MVHLLINKQTTDNTGGIVAAGAIIAFDTKFPVGTNSINYPTFCYRSLADYNAGMNVVVLTEVLNYNYTKVCTEKEFASLETESGAMTKVCQWRKDALVTSGKFIDTDLTIILS